MRRLPHTAQLAFAGCLILTLAGCGGGDPDDGGLSAASSGSPIQAGTEPGVSIDASASAFPHGDRRVKALGGSKDSRVADTCGGCPP